MTQNGIRFSSFIDEMEKQIADSLLVRKPSADVVFRDTNNNLVIIKELTNIKKEKAKEIRTYLFHTSCGDLAVEYTYKNRIVHITEAAKLSTYDMFRDRNFVYYLSLPGSGPVAPPIAMIKQKLAKVLGVGMRGFSAPKNCDDERKYAETMSRITYGRYLVLAKTSHAIGRLYSACRTLMKDKIDLCDIIVVKDSKDGYHPIIDEYGLDASKVLKLAEKRGELPGIILSTVNAFNALDEEVYLKLEPYLTYFMESASMTYKETLQLLLKIDPGHMSQVVLIGDKNQVLNSQDSDDRMLQSAFESYKVPRKLFPMKDPVEINVPTIEIISKRLYESKYKPKSEDLALYKTQKPPFCLVVNCMDGYEKRKKGDIVTCQGNVRGSPVISDIFTAANCAKMYLHYRIQVTILTFYDKARIAITARCKEIGLPAEFCNQHHISTVDEFQSGKDDFVILVMDKDDLGVQDLRRQNVAVTRCKTHLTLICNSKTMQQDTFKDSILYDFYRHQNSQYISASKLNKSDAKDVVDLIIPSFTKGDEIFSKA